MFRNSVRYGPGAKEMTGVLAYELSLRQKGCSGWRNAVSCGSFPFMRRLSLLVVGQVARFYPPPSPEYEPPVHCTVAGGQRMDG